MTLEDSHLSNEILTIIGYEAVIVQLSSIGENISHLNIYAFFIAITSPPRPPAPHEH